MRYSYPLFLAITVFSLLVFSSCETKKNKDTTGLAQQEKGQSEPPEQKDDVTVENDWIDESEAGNLSNTWVDEEDKGELSNTWAEDAFSEELEGSNLSNSWVDEDGETIYKKTEVPPEFVGGKEALFEYINSNIKYPEDVERGNVYIAFVVTKEGKIRDTRVVKGINESCDRRSAEIDKEHASMGSGNASGKTRKLSIWITDNLQALDFNIIEVSDPGIA